MKNINSTELGNALRRYMSNSAALYAQHVLLGTEPTAANKSRFERGRGHCAANGKHGKLFARLAAYSADQLGEWVRLESELRAAENAKEAADRNLERTQQELNLFENPSLREQYIAEANAWWDKEGRFEEELEERGLTKDYYHELENDPTLTPEEFLS